MGMVTLINLGHCMARLSQYEAGHKLEIFNPKDRTYEGDAPNEDESLTIIGRHAILALRDALNQEYPID